MGFIDGIYSWQAFRQFQNVIAGLEEGNQMLCNQG